MFVDDGVLTGKPRWQYAIGCHAARSPVIGPDGNVRVHANNGFLHVVNTSGQRVVEPIHVGEPLGWASPSVDPQNNTLISGCYGGLIRVSADGRRDEHFFRSSQQFDCTGLSHNGVFYVGAGNNCIFAITLDGNRGVNTWDHAKERGCTNGYINSPLAMSDGRTIIAVSRDDHLRAFDLEGNEIWRTSLPGQSLGAPVIGENGSIYLGVSQNRGFDNNRGMLVCIDCVSHQIRWQYNANAPVESIPVIGNDNIVYFGDNSGTVHAVDADGRGVWTENVKSDVRSPGTIIGKGLLAFGLDDGTIVVLRCSSDRLRPGGWPKFRGTQEQCGIVI
jgi:outer membrane protein assembly factor BamB